MDKLTLEQAIQELAQELWECIEEAGNDLQRAREVVNGAIDRVKGAEYDGWK